MIYNFSINDLISFFTFGALLITTIYHSILFYHNRIKLLGIYSIYLCLGLLFIFFANVTKNLPTDKVILGYTISSCILWTSYSFYFRFILAIIDPKTIDQSKFLRSVQKNWVFLPICILVNVIVFIVPQSLNSIFSMIALLFNCGILICGILLLNIIYNDKKHIYNKNFLGGSVCLIFFNVFNGIAMYNNGALFGIISISYICLGYFTEIIFFSIAISHKMRFDLDEKYKALAKIKDQELELEMEKKKASDILISHDFEIQNERTKTIIEQRTSIGRRLHDDLSGSLVALRFLVQDFKVKATSDEEKDKFKDLEAEISNIYKEARNFSHELSKSPTLADSKISYDIVAYLKKLEEQFLNIGLLTMHINLNQDDINEKLNVIQTKNVYFLLKECISNTIKHSAAKNIWIDIEFNKNKCKVYFSDDGVGAKAIGNEGMGIKGMKESAKHLNGTLELTNTPTGLSISIEFVIG